MRAKAPVAEESFLQMLLMWVSQLRHAEKGTPRILISFTISMVLLEYLMIWFSFTGLCFALNITTFVFAGFIFILLDWDHECNLSRIPLHFIIKLSSHLPDISKIQSSAYIINFASESIFTISLMNTLKRRGPSTLPCGTPVVVGKKDEMLSSIQTHWCLLVK